MTLGGYRGAGRGLAGVCLVYEASRERLVESRTAFELSFLSFCSYTIHLQSRKPTIRARRSVDMTNAISLTLAYAKSASLVIHRLIQKVTGLGDKLMCDRCCAKCRRSNFL